MDFKVILDNINKNNIMKIIEREIRERCDRGDRETEKDWIEKEETEMRGVELE